jgi:hypothetical protein
MIGLVNVLVLDYDNSFHRLQLEQTQDPHAHSSIILITLARSNNEKSMR